MAFATFTTSTISATSFTRTIDTPAATHSATVAVARKTAFRQPLGHFRKHTYYQVDVTGAILVSQPHIDRQVDVFATPGRRYSQRKDQQIQATGEDYIEGGTNRVSPSRSAIDLSAGTIEEGVVCVQRDSAFGIEDFHQQYRQYFPQLRQSPSCGWKETVKCIVRLYAQRVGKWQHAAYGSPSGGTIPKILRFSFSIFYKRNL